MKRRIALKRLSGSDLTIFEHHFRNTSGTKQKAFNLDRAVFIDELYPQLTELLSVDRDRVQTDLSIYGPGLAGLHNLQRKILKQQKNWRLNGELIYGPPEAVDRYNPLQKNDFAIFDFSSGSEPRAAKLFLIARAVAADSPMHAALEARYSPSLNSRTSMVVLDPAELADIISEHVTDSSHPLLDLVDGQILEDVAQGGFEGTKLLRKRRGSRGINRGELERAKKSASVIGRLGEELLNAWFLGEKEKGNIQDYQWDADQNAVSPYDFTIRIYHDGERSLDAKSTAGNFENKIHISLGELFEMRDGGKPYDLYRLYQVTDSSAMLRVARDISGFASNVLSSFEGIPDGVLVDSVSVKPSLLDFGQELTIDIGEESIVE